jgi:hypothetical protein
MDRKKRERAAGRLSAAVGTAPLKPKAGLNGAPRAKDFAAKDPGAYEEIWRNGKTFMGLRVNLSTISVDRVRELIETSWRHSMPPRSNQK